MSLVRQLEDVEETLDRLERERGPQQTLLVLPWWVPAFLEGDRSRTLPYFDYAGMFAINEESGCGREDDDSSSLREAWSPVPVDGLKALIASETRPRRIALAVRFMAQARTPGAIEFLESRLDDVRPAGLFPFHPANSDPQAAVEWRPLTIADVVRAALNHMIGDFQQHKEFTPFASAEEYRAWRRENPVLLDSVDVWRNALEVASMNASIGLPGEAWDQGKLVAGLRGRDAALAAVVLYSRPTYSHYGIGAPATAELMRAAFPEGRVLRILSGEERVSALRSRSDQGNFRRWLLAGNGITSASAARLLALWEAHPEDPCLATLAARLHPARRRDILRSCLDRIDLEGDLSDSLYPQALAALTRAGEVEGLQRFFFRPRISDGNAVMILDALADADPETARRTLSCFVLDARFGVVESRLVGSEVEWPLLQGLLRVVKGAGYPLPDFGGYVWSTSGTSPWYPSLAGWTPDRPASEPHLAARRTLVDQIKAWLTAK